MPKKILVINGHGAKLPKKMHISSKHSIMTPGNADSSYVVSFDNQERHLEEMTSQGKIWPIIDGAGKPVQWHRYEETEVHDIKISPLQSGFNFSHFANAVLNKKTTWENLSTPPHDVKARGALAVKAINGDITIYEGAQLTQYLQQMANKTNQGTPLFFCDKELGKIKPLGNTSLSDIYAGVALIDELQASGTEIIVATCSPSKATAVQVMVQTKQPATEMEHTAIVNMVPSVPVTPAFVLNDAGGNNYVDSIQPIDGGGYLIKGRTHTGGARSITIDQHGKATGPNGSEDLGIVGRQMDKNRAALFAHFKIPLPDFKSVKPTEKIIATPIVEPSTYAKGSMGSILDERIATEREHGGRHGSQNAAYATILKDILSRNGLTNKPVTLTPQLEKLITDAVFALRVKGGYEHEQTKQAMMSSANHPPELVALLQELDPLKKTMSVDTTPTFTLIDSKGNNSVDSVEPIADGGYLIKGRTHTGELRSIIIDKDGNATRPDGNKDLGIVGGQMYEQRKNIFAHFKIPTSDVVKGVAATSATTIVDPGTKKEKEPSALEALVKTVNAKVGTFATYQTTSGHGENIPFTSKPAQQLLHGVGVSDDVDAALSKKADGKPLSQHGNTSVIVSSFDPKSQAKLEITGARIDRLLKSAKTYVNTDIFPAGHFAEVVSPGTLTPQTKATSSKTGVHLQNLAVGVCHVQEIDLLAAPIITADGKAILGPRTGVIDADAPAMLLLSSPALNVAYGTGKSLTQEQQVQYIESMYRTLFHAATSEGREYIALPAAGLGVFGGDPKTYFTALMKIAKEFPQLNIIYNSGHPKNAPVFDQLLEQQKPANLVRTDRDVLIVAHELTQQGKPCAFHNPSDADVVLGINDVGEYWKNGTGAGYVGEEHIGAMTTAALNSRLLNPKAYQNVAEHSFLPKPIYTLKKEGATVPAPTVTMPHKENHEIIPPTKKTIPQACTFMEKFHNLKGKDLTSTRFLPFEKYNKNDKEEEMTRLIKEITHSSDPNVIGTKLGELFRVACTVRNWLSSEKYSLDTHSASELRTKLLQSDKIVSFLGLDKEANKDSALRSLMKQATDGKDIQIPQEAEEKVDHIDDTPHADDSSSAAPGF